jgi:hypothetical protein
MSAFYKISLGILTRVPIEIIGALYYNKFYNVRPTANTRPSILPAGELPGALITARFFQES